MKKRVVVLAEYFPPRLGSDRRIFELMKRLAWKYDIYFVTLPPSYTLFIRKIDSFAEEANQVSYGNMRGYKLGLPKFIWKLWINSFILAFMVTEIYLFFKMLKKIVQLKPQIIIINDTSVYTGLIGFVCSKIMNKKLLVDYNDLMGLYTFELIRTKSYNFLQAIVKRTLVLVEDFLVKYGWKVATITVFIKRYASTRNIRKDIVVIPNGVDTRLFDPTKVNGQKVRDKYGIGGKEILCVYTGRIDECAGAEIIFKTAKLLRKNTDIKFMIIGEGNPRIVKAFTKCDNVIFIGHISRESVPEYLAAADIVFVPFPNNVACHGISPLKLFEALAMEKPVIASAISGIKEALCQDLDVTLVSDDPKLWASAVMELVRNDERTVQLSQNNRKVVCQRFDMDELARDFDKVIGSAF